MAASGLRRPNDPPLLILVSLADGPKHGHALAFWWSATQDPAWLVAAPLDLVTASVSTWLGLRVAARQGRRLRGAARRRDS
jgi:uncharacterized RDD family membrane protein YckC